MRRSAALTAVLLHATALAQGPLTGLAEAPGRVPDVPTLESITGFALGSEPTTHAETAAYVRALAAASPRAVHVPYGRSWEGRSLDLLVISAPRHLARLDEIRKATARLADPRGAADGEIDALCAELPATSWLAYSVHGDEASTTDAALWLAWHLCTADGDPVVDRILDQSIVVIDPLQNPDGRDRFVHHARQTRGRWPDPSPDAAVRDQPWPGGRSNHALCDMNRDWFGLTQPETRARVRAFQDFWPQLFVDVHEMGTNSTYYFGPPALPHNPEVTEGQHAWLERYGRENARWFDERGFDYFTRELFDLFYPGYGDSWPTFQGAVAMTYEVASARGLAVDREDGTQLTFPDTVTQHAVASLASCATTAANREAVLRRFAADRQGAVDAGREGSTREFVLLPSPDPGRARRLAERLAFQGIEVRRLDADHEHPAVRAHGATTESGAGTLPAGSYLIRLDQPSGRLARVLLSRHQDMDPDFVAEQVERQKDRRGTEIYDVTAWSVPLLYGVECRETDSFTTAATTPVAVTGLDEPVAGTGAAPADANARVAYVVPRADSKPTHDQLRPRPSSPTSCAAATACSARASRSASVNGPARPVRWSSRSTATRRPSTTTCAPRPRPTAPRSCPATRPGSTTACTSAATGSAASAPRASRSRGTGRRVPTRRAPRGTCSRSATGSRSRSCGQHASAAPNSNASTCSSCPTDRATRVSSERVLPTRSEPGSVAAGRWSRSAAARRAG